MSILNRILLNQVATCLVLAIFQSCQISTVAQERILPGPKPDAIPIRETHTNNYNNDLGPHTLPASAVEPEGTSTVSIINQILQDRYLRSPVAVIIDTAPPFLHRAKKLLQAVVSTNASINLLLIPYNSTDIGPVQKPTDMTQLRNAIHDLRSTTQGYSNRRGVAFYSILKATEKVPYDSAILLFTGRPAEDEDIAAITTENLTSKRCKLYVVWLDPPPLQNPGIETLYAEVAHITGGSFHFVKASDFSQVGTGDATNETPLTEMEQVSEVTLAMRQGLAGLTRLPIQVDKTVTSLFVTIQGPVNTALLQDPFGNAVDLTQNASLRAGYKVLLRDDNILSIQLNTGVGEQGRWILKTAGADAGTRYNVIVTGTSSLYFNASTTVLPSWHANGTEDEGSINPNIQFQLSIPENIATIQNVSLVNKDGNKLGHLQYNPGTDLLPAINISENKLSSEPLYLLLTASTHDGEVVERLVEVERQTRRYTVPFTVDVLALSTLEVQPGDTLNLFFNVTNHQTQPAVLTFTCLRDQYIFPQLFIRPPVTDVPPGSSIQVMVTGLINRNARTGTKATIEFLARPYRGTYPTVNRAAYLLIGVPHISDSNRPTINYSVKDNCKNVPQERCSTSAWNMEATVQDSQSGLISVASNPSGVEFLTRFIAGTKDAVPVAYSASCCAPTVDIKATDAKGNYVTKHIDANADNEGLSEAEIAVVILGVLLALIIIVVIVLAVILCKKQRSHTLQHSSH